MKRLAVLSVLAFLFLVAANEKQQVPLGVEVTIAPTENDPYQLLGPKRSIPGAYRCTARVYDASETRFTFVAPQVVVSPGRRESKTVKEQDLSVTFTVAVSQANDRAMTEVTAKRGDKIVLKQKSDVMLRTPGRAIVPLR
jgi:hypothetical protein